jgi:hypothetical protein
MNYNVIKDLEVLPDLTIKLESSVLFGDKIVYSVFDNRTLITDISVMIILLDKMCSVYNIMDRIQYEHYCN